MLFISGLPPNYEYVQELNRNSNMQITLLSVCICDETFSIVFDLLHNNSHARMIFSISL